MLASSWRSPVFGVRSLSRRIWSALSSMPSAAVYSSTRDTPLVPGRDVSTEDLRVALQRYHSFFQRLLSA